MFYVSVFQKYDVCQTFPNLQERNHNNVLVKDNAQNEDSREEISRIWNVRFDMMDESEVPSNQTEMCQSYGEGSTCSSLASDISCDSVTQESTVELVPDTKDNSLNGHITEEFPQLDQRLQSWRSTLVRTSQQQIIDCVVDSMCVSGDKIASEWISKDLEFQFEPMNNNVYKSFSIRNPVASCCNLSGTNKSLEFNFQSSQDQNFTELLTHQSDTNGPIEENNNTITNGNNCIIVNNPENIGIDTSPQEENFTPETALLVEIKADSLAGELVTELNKGEYEIHIVENNPIDNYIKTIDPTEHLEANNNSQVNSFDDGGSESNNPIKAEYQTPSVEIQSETSTERAEYSNVKPVRACKGVRYREFMSTNQLGKRRVKQKQR